MLAYQKIHRRGYRRIGFVAHDNELKYNGMIFELGYLGGHKIVGDSQALPRLLLGDTRLAKTRKQLSL